jgi:endonuclease/exonuclease/phosphatase family metal-dependent hydrolase
MSIKVLTLNLRHNADRWQERLPLVLDTLLTESPDVIGLQEVWLPIQQAELIANLLNDRVERPYSVFTGQKWGEHTVEGIAMLSRLPVLVYEHTNLPETSRLAQRLRVMVDGHPVDVVNTHLHHEPHFEETIRLPQMQHILNWMFEREGDYPWVLMGDMNALPASSTIQAASQHLVSALPADAVTFPAPLCAADFPPELAVQIDYILYDASRLRLLNAAVIAQQTHPQDATLSASDHYGVAAQFEVVDIVRAMLGGQS